MSSQNNSFAFAWLVVKVHRLAFGDSGEAILAHDETPGDVVASWKRNFVNDAKFSVGSLQISMKSFCELLVPRGLLSDEVSFVMTCQYLASC